MVWKTLKKNDEVNTKSKKIEERLLENNDISKLSEFNETTKSFEELDNETERSM